MYYYSLFWNRTLKHSFSLPLYYHSNEEVDENYYFNDLMSIKYKNMQFDELFYCT